MTTATRQLLGLARLLVIAMATVLLSASNALAQIIEDDPHASFQAANTLYLESDEEDDPRNALATAIAHYKSVLDAGENPAVHFNLGNTYYQLGRSGSAVLHFERALALNPKLASARANLAYVRTEHELTTVPDTPFEQLARHLAEPHWTYLATGLVWVLVLAATAMIWQRRLVPWAVGLTSFAVVALAACCVALAGYHQLAQRAVVEGETVILRATPSAEGTPTGEMLNAGDVVRLEGQENGFVRVRASDDRVGWMPLRPAVPIWSDTRP